MKKHILIVDDERGARDGLAKLLQLDYSVTSAKDGLEAINLLKSNTFDVVLTDLRMPNSDGMSVLQMSTEKNIPCIVMTAYGSVETAVDAMRKGAYDFITKPVIFDQLEIMLNRLFESHALKEENKSLKKKLDIVNAKAPIIGHSKAMKKILEMVEFVAPTKSNILITGESGTGKELIAQMLHQYSHRTGQFIAVHCAALPENLLESELFGHEKGAFTGATEMRKGRFELANHGTLFLDEIGEVSPSVQVKLLRALETQSVERIGGSEPIQTHARLITATHRNLQTMCENGDFREDLFFRLDVVRIHLPPLRERKEDIPLLINYFMKRFAEENQKQIEGITPEAIEILCKYRWPGNIRELRNCIERMVVLSRLSTINTENLPANILQLPSQTVVNSSTVSQAKTLDLHEHEKNLIIEAIRRAEGNRSLAAKNLGISRRTLYRKIEEFKINL